MKTVLRDKGPGSERIGRGRLCLNQCNDEALPEERGLDQGCWDSVYVIHV